VFLSFILTSIWIYGIIAADAAAQTPACGSAGEGLCLFDSSVLPFTVPRSTIKQLVLLLIDPMGSTVGGNDTIQPFTGGDGVPSRSGYKNHSSVTHGNLISVQIDILSVSPSVPHG